MYALFVCTFVCSLWRSETFSSPRGVKPNKPVNNLFGLATSSTFTVGHRESGGSIRPVISRMSTKQLLTAASGAQTAETKGSRTLCADPYSGRLPIWESSCICVLRWCVCVGEWPCQVMHEWIRSAHMHVIRKTGASRRPRLFNAGSFSGLLCVRLRGVTEAAAKAGRGGHRRPSLVWLSRLKVRAAESHVFSKIFCYFTGIPAASLPSHPVCRR